MFAGLQFNEGWWFIQVVGTETVELKPYVLKNENGNQAALAPGESGIESEEIKDDNGNRVLEPKDDNRNTVHQVLYGIDPSRMQTFHLFGRDRNVSLQDYDRPGDPAPSITGYDTPYNNPSRDSEVFYVNSMAPLRIQAHNPMDEESEARLSFHVNKIHYTTITDTGLMKAMLQGQQPARLTQIGGGVQARDRVSIPNWVTEAFGSHIRTTEEILSSSSGNNGQSPESPNAPELQ